MADIKLRDHEIALSAVFGKKIAEIAGYVSDEFGKDTLVFKITRIVFEGGYAEHVEGEYDCPYLPSDEEMQALLEPHYKEEE